MVSFYKYLGMYFTPKLLWTKTLESQALQGLKSSVSIFKFQKKFGFLVRKICLNYLILLKNQFYATDQKFGVIDTAKR